MFGRAFQVAKSLAEDWGREIRIANCSVSVFFGVGYGMVWYGMVWRLKGGSGGGRGILRVPEVPIL